MSALAFSLPARLEARVPPEARHLARDGVRLMAASRAEGRIVHARFRDLPSLLLAGDLLVVNTSATLAAALPARRRRGREPDVLLHFATRAPGLTGDRWWVVELRTPAGGEPTPPVDRLRPGESLGLAGGGAIEILAPYARAGGSGASRAPAQVGGGRLWLGRVDIDEPVVDYLGRHGRPIRYPYVDGAWPLAAYQTTYAATPGSAEMPSAGRPFTPELLARLVARGVALTPVLLHTGVSSPERHEPPYPEYYRVPAATAGLVNAVRRRGGRIVAVGTTVVRALETVAAADGRLAPGAGWTDLLVTPERGLRVVDGLISGWHEPAATHLEMLEALAGGELLERCYRAALEYGYLWHEFGDSHLIMP